MSPNGSKMTYCAAAAALRGDIVFLTWWDPISSIAQLVEIVFERALFSQTTLHCNIKQDRKGGTKEIQIILRLFLVIAMYCQASSSQFFSITQPLTLLAGWEGSLGRCSR